MGPFKWNLLSSTLPWYCLLVLCKVVLIWWSVDESWSVTTQIKSVLYKGEHARNPCIKTELWCGFLIHFLSESAYSTKFHLLFFFLKKTGQFGRGLQPTTSPDSCVTTLMFISICKISFPVVCLAFIQRQVVDPPKYTVKLKYQQRKV